ncbi:MAG: SPFH/Band 7/PHB domain protein [Chloroflexi bacterium]|nr:SPFH/Band 7/PHB domain protein [Chloroflexota bacterium]
MATVLLAIIIILVVVFLSQSLRIAREYQRLIIFRLGKCIGSRGPGPVLLIPLIDRPVLVDLREQFTEIPHQTCITEDNVPISIDFLIYRQVVDPVTSVIAVNNFAGAAQGIAATTLRAIVGDILLDEVLAKREQINEVLRTKLDEVTQRWGVKVTAVEIREILPPREVQEAMNRQMSAERSRRAAVTESEGKRQSTINVAEGEKGAAILRAEGEKQARVLQAEGYAQALQTVYSAANTIDAKTMTLQFIDGIKALGASSSTKFVIPMEFVKLFGQIGNYLETAIPRENAAEALRTATPPAMPIPISAPKGDGETR